MLRAMKLKFKTQAHQSAAVQAVLDCFKGPGTALDAAAGTQLSLIPNARADLAWSGGNAPVRLSEQAILHNLRLVQQRQGLPLATALTSTPVAQFNFDIEMETGTGKTYCYIKTIFELHRACGWSKFIVVVPSIAIREGVAKSFEVTAEHFLESYKTRLRYFVYHSKRLHQLESFASDAGINVMIINIQAFAARAAEQRRFYEELDDFQSRRPVDVIASCRPVLILDEPQKMEGEQTLEALAKLQALLALRYSATHKTVHDLVYRLDAFAAYQHKLVKKISVRGISANRAVPGAGLLYLQSVERVQGAPPTATVEMEENSCGSVLRCTRRLRADTDLYHLSQGLEGYRGFVVEEINAQTNRVAFRNGVELQVGEFYGAASELLLSRLQIREAIRAHFEKELGLFHRGVKVLTLFFIDQVAKYRDYSRFDQKGEYARIFEEEYALCLEQISPAGHEPYGKYLNQIKPEQTHSGYFSIDKRSQRLVDPVLEKRGSNLGHANDADAYDLILKDKERLLSFDEPVRFIFSHSALREGWDNPNVFVICALKQGESHVSRRQEVGRGLRLSVNQHGERMDQPALVHDVNVLTVVARESYKDYVAALQRDLGGPWLRPHTKAASEGSEGAGDADLQAYQIIDERVAKFALLDANFRHPEFVEFWQRISRQAVFTVQSDAVDLIEAAAACLNRELALTRLQFAVDTVEQSAALDGAASSTPGAFVHRGTQLIEATAGLLPASKRDLIGALAERTQLTRRDVALILSRVNSNCFDQYRLNPEPFTADAARLINAQKTAWIAQHLRYLSLGCGHDLAAFTANLSRSTTPYACARLQRHVSDGVSAASEAERRFILQLDAHAAIQLHAKLPDSLTIPTPLGEYHPDWMVLFRAGSVRQRFFVLDTQSALAASRPSQKAVARLDCVRKFFEQLHGHQSPMPIQFVSLASFEELLERAGLG